MIEKMSIDDNWAEALQKVGLAERLKEKPSVLVKINLARPPKEHHPRTDPELIRKLIEYLHDQGVTCTLAECADGYLEENIRLIGLESVVEKYQVGLLDLDFAEFEAVSIGDELHYVPTCLKEFDLRIAIPVASKRPGSIFSNNVKLFMGAVPRKMYFVPGQEGRNRQQLHLDLHKSVANVYRAIEQIAPFHYYINGGNVMLEGQGEYRLDYDLVSDDALRTDLHFVENIFGIELPEYLQSLLEEKSIGH